MRGLVARKYRPVSEDVQVIRGRLPFEGFYRNQYRPVLALAHVLSGSPSLAEEVTQEAFMAAYRQWDQIDNPEGWVRTAVSNKVHSWRRRRYAEVRAFARMGVGRRSTVDEMPVETAHFWAEVRRLPNRQAQTVALFYLEDRSVAETAEIVGCSESTTREHLMRGRKKLARRLNVEDGT
jgi:RNA polymerase sigma factor (sigma-70 family)